MICMEPTQTMVESDSVVVGMCHIDNVCEASGVDGEFTSFVHDVVTFIALELDQFEILAALIDDYGEDDTYIEILFFSSLGKVSLELDANFADPESGFRLFINALNYLPFAFEYANIQRSSDDKPDPRIISKESVSAIIKTINNRSPNKLCSPQKMPEKGEDVESLQNVAPTHRVEPESEEDDVRKMNEYWYFDLAFDPDTGTAMKQYAKALGVLFISGAIAWRILH